MIRSGKVEAGTDSSTWRETVLWCSHCSVIHGTRLISHGVGARGWAMQRLIGVFRSAGELALCVSVTVLLSWSDGSVRTSDMRVPSARLA